VIDMTHPTTQPDPRPGDALIVVDVQNDFLPGGALGVPDGDAVVPVLNRYLARFAAAGLPVFATRDWHPAGHCSFAARGGPWPPHCIQETPGAAYAADLELPPATHHVLKGSDLDQDSYSGFGGTRLADELRAAGAERLFIGGLATDYCVLNTVLDARREGFAVRLLLDAIRAVEVNPGDGDAAIERMRAAGAEPLTLETLA
jgi:nicotinamidase/pyrazinamidase